MTDMIFTTTRLLAIGVGILMLAPCAVVFAQDAETAKKIQFLRRTRNTDESKVPSYALPDPLVFEDGSRVTSAEQWKRRRIEILGLFEREVYGKTPLGRPDTFRWETLSEEKALNGKAVRKIVRLHFFAEPDSAVLDVLIYLPVHAEAGRPVPVAMGLNFKGNHSTCEDPGIPLGTVWIEKRDGFRRFRAPEPATEEGRGEQQGRWPVELMLERGFAMATAYYCQAEPDFDGGIEFGVRKNLPRPRENEWGSIGAWAWALSRIMDYIAEDGAEKRLDPKRVLLTGHSRLGKTALWAGAQDERFAIVVSNNSGCGGAALSRREYGETVHLLNLVRPEWFATRFHRYNERIDECPVDQHELIALQAPRPVYVTSATLDVGADPKGEFQAGLGADPVYRLLGTDGIGGVRQMPEPDTPVGGRIHYHVRTGKHDMTPYDWQQILLFAQRFFGP